ncbi:MAG: helix-turn-helix transcriptional regulator [Desulfuromonadales bacterium]|nr:helix-turn-helix transcriptional regulator [Desulfuromonadales bacterium]
MQPNKIRALMVEKGIKQADIARDLGINLVSVHGTIYGKWRSRRVAREIAARLDMPVEKLFPYAS